MKPPGGDWTAFVFVAVMGGIALLGGGFLGGYALGHVTSTTVAEVAPTPSATATPTSEPTATPTPTPTDTPTPSPTPTPQATPLCWFGDFPYYPGSLAVAASTRGAEAWHVNQPAETVARYFANGASQFAWQFDLSSQTASQWNFRMTRAPACRGSFRVVADRAGGTLYEAIPDSQ